MKIYLSLLLLLFCSLNIVAQDYLSFNLNKSSTNSSLPNRVVSDNLNKSLVVSFTFPGAFVNKTMVEEHGEFDNLYIEGFGPMGKVGKPALPVHNSLVAIPGGESNVEIEIIKEEFIEYGINLTDSNRN